MDPSQQPPIQQPQPQAPQGGSQQQYAAPQQVDPGQTLSIIGIVMGFVGLSLIGLIMGIIGRKKSKAAGFSGTLGLVAIILNAVFVVLIGLIVVPALIVTSYVGIQDKAEDASYQTSANEVRTHAEAYSVKNNDTYPTYFQITSADVSLNSETKILLKEGVAATADKPLVYDLPCEKGATISYWASSTNSPVTLKAGNPDACLSVN